MAARVTGVKELDRALESIKKKTRNQYSRKAMRAGGKIVVAAAKSAAPDRRRREDKKLVMGLRRSMFQKIKTYRHTGKVISVIGPRWPEGAHAHLVEFGHRMVTADGRTVGRVRPHPFLRPAFHSSRSQVKAAIIGSYRASFKMVTKRG